MGMEITRTGTGIQLRGDDVFPRGAAGFGRARHGENQGVVRHPGNGARLERGGANLFKGEHAEHLAEAFHLAVEQREQRFRRLIACGKAGAAGDQHHLHLIAGDPLRDLRANGVAVLLHDRFIDDVMPRVMGRLAQPVAGGIILFATAVGNGKDSNACRDKFCAYLTHLLIPS